jgi:hypothetical protein
MSSKHDEHYRGEVEPIEMIEYMGERLAGKVSFQAIYSLLQAVKYIRRAGRKEGEPWRKDLDKAINYLHRAFLGKWV